MEFETGLDDFLTEINTKFTLSSVIIILVSQAAPPEAVAFGKQAL